MSITQVISPIPAPAPSRADPVNFNARSEAMLNALPTLSTEINTWRTQTNALAGTVNSQSTQVAADTVTVRQIRDAVLPATNTATQAAASATSAKNDAVAARDAAQGYASQAQATNPDTPIRLNPQAITADFTIPANYNGYSAGPIFIHDGAHVTVTQNSHWSIV